MSNDFRLTLENGGRYAFTAADVHAFREGWAKFCPHLPQPSTPYEAEAILPRARTEAKSAAVKA